MSVIMIMLTLVLGLGMLVIGLLSKSKWATNASILLLGIFLYQLLRIFGFIVH